MNKHSFERSPLYEFLLQPSPRVDFHLVLNTCRLFKYSVFRLPIEPPMFMIFAFDSCCCANQSGHFRCVPSSVLIVGSSCTDSTESLFCHEQCNPVRLLPVETSDRFWNPGSCMDIQQLTSVSRNARNASGQPQGLLQERLQGRRCL